MVDTATDKKILAKKSRLEDIKFIKMWLFCYFFYLLQILFTHLFTITITIYNFDHIPLFHDVDSVFKSSLFFKIEIFGFPHLPSLTVFYAWIFNSLPNVIHIVYIICIFTNLTRSLVSKLLIYLFVYHFTFFLPILFFQDG